MAALVAVCFAAGWFGMAPQRAAAPDVHAAAETGASAPRIEPAVAEVPQDGRPNYNYSVIPGGAHSPQELAHAIQTDSVVADHYRDVDPASMRVQTVASDRLAYVSYRKNDQVFWTKKKVRIYEGETILTDGDTEIRGRCGNAISMAPMLPTADDEPDTAVFDALTDVGPKLIAFDLTPWGVPQPEGVVAPTVPPAVSFFGGGGGGFGGGGAGGSSAAVPQSIDPVVDASVSSGCTGPMPGMPGMAAVRSVDAGRARSASLMSEVADSETCPDSSGANLSGIDASQSDLFRNDFPGGDPSSDDTLVLQPLLSDDPGGDDPPNELTIDQHLNPTPVPEPTTLLLFGSGIAGLFARHRRKKSN